MSGILSTLRHWEPLFALLIAIAAGFIAFFGVRIQEDTAQKQLRAYVVVEPAPLLNFEVGSKVEGHVWVGNSGQTPARQTQRYMAVRVLPPQSVTQTDFQRIATREVGTITIAPGQRKDYVRRESAGALSDDRLKSILEGKLRVYVFGRVTYFDIYDDEHTVEFCHMYYGNRRDTRRLNRFRGREARYCDHDNKAD